jgi:aspartyl-tRNA(Asn)/glutamyl-tRNA(Gln) amidotransferase subunit C
MITREDVEHVAVLSKMKFKEQDYILFTKQLEEMLNFVEKLREVNTDDIEPTSSVLPLKNVVREDKIAASFDRDIALMNAPDKDFGHFKIPKILE